MKKIFTLLIIALSMGLSSCSTKQSAINDLRDLRNDIANYGYQYDVNEWIDAKNRFESIQNKLRKHQDDFTYQESKEVGRLKGECIAEFGKGVLQNIGNKAANLRGEFEGILEGLKEFKDAFKQ